jgi:hypothetical protein
VFFILQEEGEGMPDQDQVMEILADLRDRMVSKSRKKDSHCRMNNYKG